MNPLETITVEEWEERYKPIPNVLDPNASWDGIMYETYGDDFDLILKYPNEQIWTYIDGDDGTYLITGCHVVNRIGYFICEKTWRNENIQVIVSKDS
jgi:hypothetical protein